MLLWNLPIVYISTRIKFQFNNLLQFDFGKSSFTRQIANITSTIIMYQVSAKKKRHL